MMFIDSPVYVVSSIEGFRDAGPETTAEISAQTWVCGIYKLMFFATSLGSAPV